MPSQPTRSVGLLLTPEEGFLLVGPPEETFLPNYRKLNDRLLGVFLAGGLGAGSVLLFLYGTGLLGGEVPSLNGTRIVLLVLLAVLGAFFMASTVAMLGKLLPWFRWRVHLCSEGVVVVRAEGVFAARWTDMLEVQVIKGPEDSNLGQLPFDLAIGTLSHLAILRKDGISLYLECGTVNGQQRLGERLQEEAVQRGISFRVCAHLSDELKTGGRGVLWPPQPPRGVGFQSPTLLQDCNESRGRG